jgi:hypothetical protein
MFAVNAGDLHQFRNNPVHPVNMLLVPLLTDTVVQCESEPGDGDALLVSSQAAESWNALVHVIRKGSGRYRGILRHQLRIYRKYGSAWKRV